jgi:hypothetical protein
MRSRTRSKTPAISCRLSTFLPLPTRWNSNGVWMNPSII